MSRKTARETAFLQLYALSQGGECNYEQAQDLSLEEVPVQKKASRTDVNFAQMLTSGVSQAFFELDKRIAGHSPSWNIERIAWVDRCILRLAVFEMLYCEQIPASVSINEAVELSKKYGGEKSAPFVNGVLGGVQRALSADGGEGPKNQASPGVEPGEGEKPAVFDVQEDWIKNPTQNETKQE